MRRICLFLLVVLIVPVYAEGANNLNGEETEKDGVHSFCTEGKKWHYTHLDVSATPMKQPYSYEVRGDTVIGEMVYKKVYRQKDSQERLAFMIREQGDEVFKLYPEQEEFLFFDFGRDDAGQVHSWTSWSGLTITNWMVSAIDTVQVNNNYFRRYYCYQEYNNEDLEMISDGQRDYWVDGIGDARYGIEAKGLEITIRLPGITEYFDSCEVNGECIFTSEDFTKPAYTTDLKRVRNTVLQEASVYNLHGHRISSPTKGINIIRRSDGTVRKVMNR